MFGKEFILDFSGYYKELCSCWGKAYRVDLTGISGTNCYCGEDACKAIREMLEDFPAEGLHWIDTGDYHYATLFFLEKISEPFTLFLFDHHPDDQDSTFGTGILSCGNWVRQARMLPCLKDDFLIDRYIDVLPEIGGKAYLSIDKDVLDRAYSRTNWDQGYMSLTEMETQIRKISDYYDIIGADVCGGLTAPKGALAEDYVINRKTDKELRELLLNLKIV